ncbi:DUF1534 domain-containing protein [Pseudomonas sp. KBS0707]|nr:DUF1534 domain-containing protein [Pseudomonas sp. KBS0707]
MYLQPSEHRSFLTLQHGNAVHDALRRKRTQSVQTGTHAEHGHDSVPLHAPGDDRCSFSRTLRSTNHAST